LDIIRTNLTLQNIGKSKITAAQKDANKVINLVSGKRYDVLSELNRLKMGQENALNSLKVLTINLQFGCSILNY